MEAIVAIIAAYAFLFTFPLRFHRPTEINFGPTLRRASETWHETAFVPSPPVALIERRVRVDVVEEAKSDDDFVPPAWGWFALIATVAFHCVM